MSLTSRLLFIVTAALTLGTVASCGRSGDRSGSAAGAAPVPSVAGSGPAGSGPAGSGSGEGGAAPSGPAPAGPTGATPACAAAALRASFQPGGGGMGVRYGAIALRNASGRTCTLSGYLGVQMVDRSGGAVPTRVTRDGGPAAVFPLATGRSAWTTVRWTVIPAADEANPCEPVTSSFAVTVPGDRAPVRVQLSIGPVCEHGQLTLGPLSTTPPAAG
jgi:hypothetical protein